MSALIVTGTDTDVGKTIVAAGLTAALGATYWKPVQAGLISPTDRETVARLSARATLPERYRLRLPASPHLAAEAEGITIDTDALSLPAARDPLIVEGAGGVMVPLTRDTLFLDLFARWNAPVVLVARTGLGTINHTGLSISALRHAGCALAGVIFNGPPETAAEESITQMWQVRHLGRVAPLEGFTPAALRRAFRGVDTAHLRRLL